MQPTDPDLQCPIDSKLLRNAVKTTCCNTSYCEDCINTYLNSHSSVCPNCETKLKNPAKQLIPDEDRRVRIKEYVEEMVRASKGDEGEEEAKEELKSESGEINEAETSVKLEEATKPSASPSIAPSPLPEMSRDASQPPNNEPIDSNGLAAQDGQFMNGTSMAGNPMMNMMNGQNSSNGGIPTNMNFPMNPIMMIQQTIMQAQMMLSNPNLSPMERQNWGNQLQQALFMANMNGINMGMPMMNMNTANQNQNPSMAGPVRHQRGGYVGGGKRSSPFGPNSGAIRPGDNRGTQPARRDRPADFVTVAGNSNSSS